MIRLAKPYIPPEALKNVTNVINSGYFVQGRYVEDFENGINEYLGIKYSVAVSSGTAALHLSLIASDIKEGDEVIVPAFTFPATVNVIEMVGAKPVLVDISLSDYCIDPGLIEERITSQTKAIMPVHEFGLAADMGPIHEIAMRRNLMIIEDAACGLGAQYNDGRVGTLGDIGCFSLHPRKTITTGEGGIVVTSSEKSFERFRSLRNHGFYKSGGKFDVSMPGLNYRMTELQAAIGIPQLSIIDQFINTRREQAEIYNEFLAGNDHLEVPKAFASRKHVFQTYHILLNNRNRDSVINELKNQGIEANFGAYAIHCLEYYRKKYGYEEQDYPNAALAYQQGLALPLGDHLSDDDISTVIKCLIEIISK
jgi:dTDP-4-amino-4,6-dideoxygalactose transaminase